MLKRASGTIINRKHIYLYIRIFFLVQYGNVEADCVFEYDKNNNQNDQSVSNIKYDADYNNKLLSNLFGYSTRKFLLNRGTF